MGQQQKPTKRSLYTLKKLSCIQTDTKVSFSSQDILIKKLKIVDDCCKILRISPLILCTEKLNSHGNLNWVY